jgi:hypothetical protein
MVLTIEADTIKPRATLIFGTASASLRGRQWCFRLSRRLARPSGLGKVSKLTVE